MQNDLHYNIICLSNQQWDYPLPTNKRHIMERMGKLGHRVLFVDPPINTGRLFLRQILRGQWPVSRLITQTYQQDNVLVYSPLNPVPDVKITTKLHISKIGSLAKNHFVPGNKTILWVYHVEMPLLKAYVNEISRDLLIYDCVDNYTAFPERSLFYSAVAPKQKIIEQEKMVTEKADLVFATTPGLVDKLNKYRETVYFMPNVGDYEKFKDVQKIKDKIPEDLASIRRPRIGFTGAIDEYKFDKDLLAKIARDHPNYNFVIIGPLALKDKEGSAKLLGVEGTSNVHFLGTRSFSIVQNYYAGFDAFIIPFQLNDYTVGGCFPIKFHDSLAAGLPTIVTDLPAYAPFKDVCYVSKSYDEFSKNIEQALREDSPEKIRARQRVAAENSWDGKLGKMLSLIAGVSKKV
uniref:Glycosyltransferase family 1 protein n=1 Tax=candidate division WWE3 bacterium TaxID=2053526 RepID=A0A7C4TLI4_UNCKA